MKTLLLINLILVMALGSIAKDPDLFRPGNSPVTSPGFKLIEKRGNISLYERWFLYDSTVRAREVKVVFDVSANIQSAINLLRDETRSDKWNSHTSEFRIIRENNDRWVNYLRYDLPWPIADHDCVLKYNLDLQSESRCLISFESGSHVYFPVNPEIARLSDIRGQWKLEQQPTSIHIEYSVTTVPSRSLPRWMTDPIIRKSLLDMMVKFSTLLEK
jgi:hypothetical protein